MLWQKFNWTFIPRSEGILRQHSNRQYTQRALFASVDLISKKFSTSESSDQIYSLSSPVHLDFVGQYVQRTDLNFSVFSRLRSCFWPHSKAFKRRISAHFNSKCLSLTWWIFWQIMPQFLEGFCEKQNEGVSGRGGLDMDQTCSWNISTLHRAKNFNSKILIIASIINGICSRNCFCPHWEDYGLRTGLLSNRGEVTVSNQARLSKGSVCNTSEFEERKSSSFSFSCLFCNLIL